MPKNEKEESFGGGLMKKLIKIIKVKIEGKNKMVYALSSIGIFQVAFHKCYKRMKQYYKLFMSNINVWCVIFTCFAGY